MAQDNSETAPAITEAVPPQATTVSPGNEKPTQVVSFTQEEIFSVDNHQGSEPEVSPVHRPVDEDEVPPSPKDNHIRVHVSRHSTETGESKLSKRRLPILWPTTKDSGPGVHWYTPTMMILLGLAGLFGALGHHLYNAGLDGEPVIDAQWPQRWGVALAFFVKMTLVGAVQMAVKQRAWVSKLCDGYIHKFYSSSTNSSGLS
jgi:hypothetical protein